MKVDEIRVTLPRKNEAMSKYFDRCEARRKFVKDTQNHYETRLRKAKHDFARAIAEFEAECWDWTIIKAYYAIHHAGNALLSKNKGLFSKDHSCLIIALKRYGLIPDQLFEDLKQLSKHFSDTLSLDLAFQLRKISQYGVDEWDKLTKHDAELILNVAKKFLKFVEEHT